MMSDSAFIEAVVKNGAQVWGVIPTDDLKEECGKLARKSGGSVIDHLLDFAVQGLRCSRMHEAPKPAHIRAKRTK